MKPTRTVDVDEFATYLDGIIMSFSCGQGIFVSEVEVEAAITALHNGETVLCRRGAVLTGTKIVIRGEAYEEVEA